MSVVDTRATPTIEQEQPAESSPVRRWQVIAIVVAGYVAAAGAVLATLLLPVR
ncbi:hypothetical protein [Pseudolysinimonas sp.]|uniref:hypothetical protein n=1 Tax=Pseudolysinimonas sp. TaxID=2680009 RepID=UPI003F80FF9A